MYSFSSSCLISVSVSGGFADFGHRYPKYCERKEDSGNLFSISTPCMPSGDVPVTKILPFLYLGNEVDSRNASTLQSNGINFVMNVSESAADSCHVIATHYMKIPVRDSTTENIVDWFQSAFDFIGKCASRNRPKGLFNNYVPPKFAHFDLPPTPCNKCSATQPRYYVTFRVLRPP